MLATFVVTFAVNFVVRLVTRTWDLPCRLHCLKEDLIPVQKYLVSGFIAVAVDIVSQVPIYQI